MLIHLKSMRAGRSLPSLKTWISVDWHNNFFLLLALSILLCSTTSLFSMRLAGSKLRRFVPLLQQRALCAQPDSDFEKQVAELVKVANRLAELTDETKKITDEYRKLESLEKQVSEIEKVALEREQGIYPKGECYPSIWLCKYSWMNYEVICATESGADPLDARIQYLEQLIEFSNRFMGWQKRIEDRF